MLPSGLRPIVSSVAALVVLAVVGTRTAGAAPGPADLPVLNVHYMLQGYFVAGSPLVDEDALGGFGRSDNFPLDLDRDDVPSGRVSLIALPEETLPLPLPFDPAYRGFRVILANTTDGVQAFGASNSMLTIVREALSPEGEWKPVEYLPSTWCGNSLHRVLLPAGQYWAFTAPVYEGSMPTTMRFALRGLDDGEVVYSNEFAGSVNPGQFSPRPGYEPLSLTDPRDN